MVIDNIIRYTLYLPYETGITDISMIALSAHCNKLRDICISRSYQVTEAVILQLLHRCRKLTRQYVSSCSLSEETWTQLQNNTQNRVSRWYLMVFGSVLKY